MIDAGFGRLTDAPATFRVVGARLVDPGSRTDATGDLGVVDGRIVEAGAVPDRAPRLDGRGLVLAPAFCDLHVHLRDPGDPAAETIASGTRAAARGGFATVCAMPNTDPALDSPDAIADVVARAADASCRVRPIGAVTLGRAGETLADLEGMVRAGAIGFSDDGAAVPSDEVATSALVALARLDVPLVEHAEDRSLAGGAVMRAGPTAVRLGLPGWPERAEVAVVERDIALAERNGARLHLTHLSSRRSVEAVRAARDRGVRVTCDATPHHLALHDGWVAGRRRFSWEEGGDEPLHEAYGYDSACRVNPPLTTAEDAQELLASVDAGVIDAIATDHAPHPQNLKLVPFESAAPGLIGLETALSIGLLAVRAGRLSLVSLLAALAIRPAAIIREDRSLAIGSTANLVLFDPGASWRVERGALASASWNTPLLGMELPGVVRLTVAEGRVTYRS